VNLKCLDIGICDDVSDLSPLTALASLRARPSAALLCSIRTPLIALVNPETLYMHGCGVFSFRSDTHHGAGDSHSLMCAVAARLIWRFEAMTSLQISIRLLKSP
jgi:hypothetical protein